MFDFMASIRRHRKLALVFAGLALSYVLCGVFLVPWVAKRQIVRYFDETLGLEADIDAVHVNPLALSVRATGLTVRDRDGGKLLGFDELYANLQASSLFRWAWTFREIRLVAPLVNVVVLEDGSLNLSVLVPDPTGPDEDEDEDVGLPRVLVESFRLEDGRATVEDRTRPTPFRTEVGPANVTIDEFATLPERNGDLAFATDLESGGRLAWSGTFGVNPIRSSGHVELVDGHMPITKKYLQDVLPVRVGEGRVDFSTDYVFAYAASEIRAALHGASIEVRDLTVNTEDGDVELLRLPAVRVAGLEVAWPDREVSAADITFAGLRAAVWRESDGGVEPMRAFAGTTTAEDGIVPDDGSTTAQTRRAGEPIAGDHDALDGWHLSLGRLAFDDLAIEVEDRTVDPPFRTGIDGTTIEFLDIDSEPGARFEFTFATNVETGGSAQASGQVGVLPGASIDAAVTVEALTLVPLQAYLDGLARLRIDSGAVSLAGQLTSSAEESLRYRGGIELADLACADVRKDERLLAVGGMAIEDLLFELSAGRLRVASVKLTRPYGRLTIYEDGTTNVADVLGVEAADGGGDFTAASGGTPADGAGPALAIAIGALEVVDGSADFADLSLPLPFASRIESLDGGVSEISSSGTSARVELEGTVDEYGLARIEGELDPFAPDRRSDVLVAFRNVEMRGLSPYSTKFAGYAVEEGRLSLDLHYRIEDRRLASENKILVESLTLGEKVDSPDAPKLPVKLAVSLLKDKDGRIELDIPVEGTLDDPEFAYGKLGWKAIRNVLKKIATAPFRALARLVGSDEDLEFVEFAAAESAIAGPARERLEKLATALAGRDELVLEVGGVYDPEIDAAEMRERELEALIAARIETLPATGGAEPALASEVRRAALESLFLEQFAREALDELTAANLSTPSTMSTDAAATTAAPAEPVLDLAAYLDDIRERLAGSIAISGDELNALAGTRAAAITAFFLEGSSIPAERIATMPIEPVKKNDAGSNWVRLRLVLSAP